MFALVDVNSFYASCESAFQPDLKGKPVVVLSNNDGCVIASNAEAKVLGVNVGAPCFKRKGLFRRCDVFYFSSNYELYTDMNSRVMSVLGGLSPRVEMRSIDETFCDLTSVRNCRGLTDSGRKIREAILQKTRLTVRAGIAQTKTLVKPTDHVAKKWQEQTGGVVDLSNVEYQRKLMAALPVDEVQGIGRRVSKKLDVMGIKTICGLADTNIRFIRRHFNVVLERTVRELRGESCLALEEFAPVKQKIICSRSFGEKFTDYNAMREAICICAARVAERLHRKHQFCRFISMFIKTSPLSLNEPYYGNSASIRPLTPTQDSRETIGVTTRSLDAVWRERQHYQKAKVMLDDFFSSDVAQLNLFDNSVPRYNSNKLMVVLDTLNAEKGKGTLYFAGQGIQQPWAMKRDVLSPRCTTRYSDLLRVGWPLLSQISVQNDSEAIQK